MSFRYTAKWIISWVSHYWQRVEAQCLESREVSWNAFRKKLKNELGSMENPEVMWWLSDKESACQCRRQQVPSLGWEDLLEEEMATYFSVPAGIIPWTEEPGGLQSLGSAVVGHDLAIKHTTTMENSTLNKSQGDWHKDPQNQNISNRVSLKLESL